MSYADTINKICEIDNQIQSLKNERLSLEKIERIYSYIERSDILGKCYKTGNSYYKIIDLEIDNHYRCIALYFYMTNFNSGLSEWIENAYSLDHADYDDMGISTISIMIKSLKSMEEISEEEFKEKYSEKMLEFLNIDKVLKEKRFQDIENFKKENDN